MGLKTHPELRPQNKGSFPTNRQPPNKNKPSYAGNSRNNKPTYMAAPVIIDEEAFLKELYDSELDTMNEEDSVKELHNSGFVVINEEDSIKELHNSALIDAEKPNHQGTTPETLAAIALAETPAQAISATGEKGEQGQGSNGVVHLGQVRTLGHPEENRVAFATNSSFCGHTVLTNDVSDPMHSNKEYTIVQHKWKPSYQMANQPLKMTNRFEALNPDTTLESNEHEDSLVDVDVTNEDHHDNESTDICRKDFKAHHQEIPLNTMDFHYGSFQVYVDDAVYQDTDEFYHVLDLTEKRVDKDLFDNYDPDEWQVDEDETPFDDYDPYERQTDEDETLFGDYGNICMAAANTPVHPDAWILDSGANVFICNDATWFSNLRTFNTTVSTANQNSAMPIVGGGTVELTLEDGDGDPFRLVLNDVAYSPTSRCNLLSLSKLAKAGMIGSCITGGDQMILKAHDNFTVGTADQINGLYHIRLYSAITENKVHKTFVANVDFADPVWKEHRRLGHLGLQRMLQLCTHSTGMNVSQEQIKAKLGQICPICATTKAIVRIPRDPAKIRYETKGELVHADIWGPYSVKGWDDTRWMIFATDDFTRRTKTARLTKLTEFPQALRVLHKQEERQYTVLIRRYRVDNQFNEGPWKTWCEKKGIAIEPIAPHAHHQVGVAERVNRTLREGASAMIHDNSVGGQIRKIIEERGNELLRNSTLPEILWPEAMDYAAWLKNRAPTRALKSGKTPWETEEGQPPDLSRERTWGSRVYVTKTAEERGRKLHDARGWLGYFVGCENESTYRVWDPHSKRVRRVAYTVVDDGQGLDDTHDRVNEEDRRQPPETNETDGSSNTSENEEDTADEGNTVSRYFAQPTAMVMTRSKKDAKDNTAHLEVPVTPPPAARIRGASPRIQRDYSPNTAWEDSYAPPISETMHTSPYFSNTQDNNEKESDTGENSTYFDTMPENEESLEQADDQEHDEDEEFGDFQSSYMDDEESDHDQVPDTLALSGPPILQRSNDEITANQMPVSDSEDDVKDTTHCANVHCRTPNSAKNNQPGPGGMRLCFACYSRYKRNPDGDWQRGQARKTPGATCSNSQCSTPKSVVSPNQRGPDGKLLCLACYMRYTRLLKTQSSVYRDPDSWRSATGARARAGMKVKPKLPKPSQDLDSSTSGEEVQLKAKRDETRRGTKLQARTPERERCQSCFDYGQNCEKTDSGKCKRCIQGKRICRPLQLNPDGSLPSERRFSKAKIQEDTELRLEQRCWSCRQSNSRCDAAQPIDYRNPCTRCRKNNSHCMSMEQHEHMHDIPMCLRCKLLSKTKQCDRGKPCNVCVEAGHSRCTYETDDGVRWLTTLTKPIPPDERQSKQDPNVDYYNPNVKQGCVNCQDAYGIPRSGGLCTFERGGPPCKQCFKWGHRNADRCKNWVAPGKIESVATRMFMLDENTGELVRNPDKTDNLTRSKRPRGKKGHARYYDPTLESTSESDQEETRVDIYSEEARAEARKRLRVHKLPEAFMAAMSLTALQQPIDNALRPDPQSYLEAMKSPDKQKWKEAIQNEYDSLIENGTWQIANLPQGRKALTTKWILKKKLGPDGSIQKYKARMVARGFQQIEGYDYTETYSGVVKTAAYRLLFALTVLNNWTCHQMDVSTAFLNGEVFEEIYIHPPQGYPHPGKVLRLLKALYGLKQSPRLWYRKLRQWLLRNNWKISKYDECVFYSSSRQLIVSVYVDDINIFGPSDEHIIPFKLEIGKVFKMTDAGRASWYLGMQLDWLPNGLHIHQNGFVQQALGRYGLLGSKPASVPLDSTRKLVKETETTAEAKFKKTYMSMVGSLNYLQSKTVWGLAFPVSLVSRFMTNPNQSHMDAVLSQFRYLIGSSHRGLFYRKNGDRMIRGFVDSDWAGDTDTGKSTTGWVFTLAGCPISWSSRRQRTVSSSSTEAEYIAASEASKEAVWLKNFHKELSSIMGHPEQDAVPLAIDNASALKLTKNPEFHGRTKHINVDHHVIREYVEQGEIVPEWIAGKDNPADLLTKPLAKALFLQDISRLGDGEPTTSVANNAPEDELV